MKNCILHNKLNKKLKHIDVDRCQHIQHVFHCNDMKQHEQKETQSKKKMML